MSDPASVDISELRLDNSNPDAVEADLTDNNKILRLMIKEPGGVETLSVGKLYYKVEAVPKDKVGEDARPEETLGAKLYVEKTAEASQDV